MNAPLSQEQRIVHFLNRTSFGPTPDDIQRAKRIGIRAYLGEQLAPERIADHGADEKVAGLKTMRLNSRELIELYPRPKLQRLQANQPGGMAMESMQGPRVVILELQQAKLLRALYSNRQLYELMVDFWTNHFNIYIAKGANRWLTTAYDRDTIRPLALGKFKDLLVATAKSPAMLFYLDNWMSADADSPGARMGGPNNRRRGLNENYARELMELHTLGVDGGLAIWAEPKGKRLSTGKLPIETIELALAVGLPRIAATAKRREILVESIDGVADGESSLARGLLAAGARIDYRGLVVRGSPSVIPQPADPDDDDPE
jgi:uncharacterized protein (DUF1800 family)